MSGLRNGHVLRCGHPCGLEVLPRRANKETSTEDAPSLRFTAKVSQSEFRKAMLALGFQASKAQMDNVFDQVDKDGSAPMALPALALRPFGWSKVDYRCVSLCELSRAPPVPRSIPGQAISTRERLRAKMALRQ